MKEVRTDRGTEYVNQVFENIANLFNVTHKVTTAYHSQSIGGCERNHRVLNEFMRMYIHETHSDWEDWIKYYKFCYNTTPSTYHQYTPFELVFDNSYILRNLESGTNYEVKVATKNVAGLSEFTNVVTMFTLNNGSAKSTSTNAHFYQDVFLILVVLLLLHW
ncbi:hypothetical protein QE152_g19874 [Popillia japonica]|uniref:Integrase catalytic domain-containing protein n=1 Tax=Popillia japonica TaxID=7064 RepID=A0AAW1KQG1_POPJA